MHFIKSLSTALVGALLATSALGQLTQVIGSIDERGLSARVNDPTDIGPDPGTKNYKEYSTKYCSNPAKHGAKRDFEQTVIKIRAQPPGFTNVIMGQAIGHKTTEPGLWSGDYGTCVGFVVTGTPEHPGGLTRYVFHLGLGTSWDEIRTPWYNFAEAGIHAKMSNMKGWIFTPDTSPNAPDVHGVEYMETMAKELEKTYTRLEAKLQYLVGSNRVIRPTHPFSVAGEIQVGPDNKVKANGRDV